MSTSEAILGGASSGTAKGLPKLQFWSFRKVLDPHVYPFGESQHGPSRAVGEDTGRWASVAAENAHFQL